MIGDEFRLLALGHVLQWRLGGETCRLAIDVAAAPLFGAETSHVTTSAAPITEHINGANTVAARCETTPHRYIVTTYAHRHEVHETVP